MPQGFGLGFEVDMRMFERAAPMEGKRRGRGWGGGERDGGAHITQPGVQKPHCDPFPSAMAVCKGWKPFCFEPSPSVVMTWQPSTAANRRRQALIGTVSTVSVPAVGMPKATVQIPHPPSPHPTWMPRMPCKGLRVRGRSVGHVLVSIRQHRRERWVGGEEGVRGRSVGYVRMSQTT
jgi:hypothetical protein